MERKILFTEIAYHVDRDKIYLYREEPGLGQALFEFESAEDASKMRKNGYDNMDKVCSVCYGGANWMMRPRNGIILLPEDNIPCYTISHEEVVAAGDMDLLFHVLYEKSGDPYNDDKWTEETNRKYAVLESYDIVPYVDVRDYADWCLMNNWNSIKEEDVSSDFYLWIRDMADQAYDEWCQDNNWRNLDFYDDVWVGDPTPAYERKDYYEN